MAIATTIEIEFSYEEVMAMIETVIKDEAEKQKMFPTGFFPEEIIEWELGDDGLIIKFGLGV